MSDLFGMGCIAPLFVPADRPERFEKAAKTGADALILDLEDAVAVGAKATARANLRVDFTDLPVFVRINAIGTPWHADDVAVVDDLPVAGIVLPKAEAARGKDGPGSHHPMIALIETARGMAEVRVVAANPRVHRLAFGSLDFCADLGCAHTREVLLPARCELVLASRAANIAAPLDGVTAALDDVALAEEDARHAGALGFGGKLCVHPRQVPAVRRGMRPSEEEIAWARRVAEAGEGVTIVANTMVDAPVRLRARRILGRIGE